MPDHDEGSVPESALPTPLFGYERREDAVVLTTANDAFETAFGTVDATPLAEWLSARGVDVPTATDIAAALVDGSPVDTHLRLQPAGDAEATRYRLRSLDRDSSEITAGADRYCLLTEQQPASTVAADRLASVISHDLRNPLDVAMAHLRVAQETGATDHLSTVADAHDRMERIIDDVLTLSRVGEPDRRRVDVAATARAAWDTVATGDAELVVDTPPTADADPNTLERLFENLFRNVTEHAGPAPTVRLGTVADGFYIADDGPGIPPAERDQVFRSGYTVDGTGTGLGLAIVGRIVAAHGWEVRVVEADDGGAQFEIVGLAAPTDR